MAIRYASEIIKEIVQRGPIEIPKGCVTGEEFEQWLMEDDHLENREPQMEDNFFTVNTEINVYIDNYGEAA